jgi:hypothetical protein
MTNPRRRRRSSSKITRSPADGLASCRYMQLVRAELQQSCRQLRCVHGHSDREPPFRAACFYTHVGPPIFFNNITRNPPSLYRYYTTNFLLPNV